ncbi:MAG TPA: flagella basal body P-ring formation protein FlgA [Novosphingobium sp.]|nr:flagella basal body P-ring formation protein FlgA [Novosphingobium sp.]
MTTGLALIAAAAATAAGAFADLDAIDRQVTAFTGAPIGAAGGAMTPVDRRLRLQPCSSGLALSWRTAMHDSVVVQCGEGKGWRIFVPVRQAAAARQAANAVNRGDAISIAVTGEGFTVSQPGEALDSGAVGDWIRVRPASAERARAEPMRARIVRPGLVALPMP